MKLRRTKKLCHFSDHPVYVDNEELIKLLKVICMSVFM